jgi:proline dehydrogenase
MMRRLFLALSQSAWLRSWMESSPLARKLNRRFVAGVTLEDEVGTCAGLASQGLWSTMDHLGENVTALSDAEASRDAYFQALDAISHHHLPSTIALKLTALGLDLNEDAAFANLRMLASRADEIGSRVEVDMEDARYTERTLRIVETVSRDTAVLRVAIQAYLRRTPADIERLNQAGVMVRLCKGAYIESPQHAMPVKADVDRAYVQLARTLLDHGTYPALATHDDAMIDAIVAHVKQRGIASDQFEFEMLHGVRRDLQRSLVERGYRVRVYVPYGEQWYRYFMRRLAERPANVWFILRNLFR